jgi:hypothetical protein
VQPFDTGAGPDRRRFDLAIGLSASVERVVEDVVRLRYCANHRSCRRFLADGRRALAERLATERRATARALKGLERDCAGPVGRRMLRALGADQRAIATPPFTRPSSLRLARAVERHLANGLLGIAACWPALAAP